LEHPPQGISPWQSPLETRRFVVEAQDLQRHFLPLVLELDLPFRGIFPKAAAASPPMSNPEGCYLFSAPTRPVMPGWAAIRATLIDAHTQEPVAHAVLEIQIDEQRWYGIANDQGNVVILFPYPSFSAFQSLSSPLSPVQQAWTLQIQVRYDPNALVRVPGSSTPTLRSIFDQAPGRLWQTRLGPSEDLRTDLLIHDEQLIIKTGGGHDLWLSPTSSPI
jgi:hypothetical protein